MLIGSTVVMLGCLLTGLPIYFSKTLVSRIKRKSTQTQDAEAVMQIRDYNQAVERAKTVMADAAKMGFVPLDSIDNNDSFQGDLQRLANAMGGTTTHLLSPMHGTVRDVDFRVFDLGVSGSPNGFFAQTVAAFVVPEGHDMSEMLALPPGLFAVSKQGDRVLIFPGRNWMMDAQQLAAFVRQWAEMHQGTISALKRGS